MSSTKHEKIINLHLKFAEDRGTDKTYCPSEVARKIYPDDWRPKMDLVRQVADTLVESGKLVVLQNGRKIDDKPSEATGPIRLRKP
ncbi:MAG: DUF3253 domain-containing protein [Pricia sp.]